MATFDKDMDIIGGATDAHSVINPANWNLIANGQDANDLITDISWDQATFRVVVTLSRPLLDGEFTLHAMASMQDVEGHSLDGDGTGGDDYVVSFTVPTVANLGEFRVNTTTSFDQKDAQIVQDAAGNFMVMWQSNNDLAFQRFNAAGEPLGDEVSLRRDYGILSSLSASVNARIAMAPNGRFSVVWQTPMNSSGIGYDYLVRFDENGVLIETDEPVHDFLGGQYTTKYLVLLSYQDLYARNYPDIGMDAAGNILITWWGKVSDSTQYAVQGLRLDANGHELAPSFVVTTTDSTPRKPILSMAADGSAVVVYQDTQYTISGYAIKGYGIDQNNIARPLNLGIYATLQSVAGARSGDFAISYLGGSPQTSRLRRFNRDGERVGDPIDNVPRGPIGVDALEIRLQQPVILPTFP